MPAAIGRLPRINACRRGIARLQPGINPARNLWLNPAAKLSVLTLLTQLACAQGQRPTSDDEASGAGHSPTELGDPSTAEGESGSSTSSTAGASTATGDSQGDSAQDTRQDDTQADTQADTHSDSQAESQDSSAESTPSCSDSDINQDETDVDCGGSTCPPCDDNAMCKTDEDCRSGSCRAGVCEATECNSDADCEYLDSDCAVGVCDDREGTCSLAPANDGRSCDDDDYCTVDDECDDGTCQGRDRDCRDEAGVCQRAVCNSEQERCDVEDLDDETPCDDNDSCTFDDHCQSGRCEGQPGGVFLREDFSDPDPDWRMQTMPDIGPSAWEIAPAQSSFGCNIGTDPTDDTSPDSTMAIAGVGVGSCGPDRISDAWDCLISPAFDLRGVSEITVTYNRHLGSDLGDVNAGTGLINHVEAKVDGAWEILQMGFSNFLVDGAWVPQSFDIDPKDSDDFQVRICFSDRRAAGATYAGWSIDDFTISDPNCVRPE